MTDLANLKRKVSQYKEVLANTVNYREIWETELRDRIVKQIEDICKEIELDATVELKETVENLEAIVISLGQTKSGLYEQVNKDVQRHLLKDNGSLIYQQLFNGKIVVMIAYPVIEGYGQPQPPKTLAIYRPEEIKPPFIIRHMEEFIKEITNWEDYDDDDQPIKKIGYRFAMPTDGEQQQQQQ